MRRLLEAAVLSPVLCAMASCVSADSLLDQRTLADPAHQALKIGPHNSRIEFVEKASKSSQAGTFNQFSGTIDLTAYDIRASRISLEIDMRSTATDVAASTQRMKSREFFDVETYPNASFVSSSIRPRSNVDSYLITGTLRFHGVARTVTFPACIRLTDQVFALDGTLSLRQADFGMVAAPKATTNEMPVKISIRAPRG